MVSLAALVIAFFIQQAATEAKPSLLGSLMHPAVVAAIFGLLGIFASKMFDSVGSVRQQKHKLSELAEAAFAKERAEFMGEQADFRREMQEELKSLRSEIGLLKAENHELKLEQGRLRAENIELRTENAHLRAQIQEWAPRKPNA